MICQDKQSYNTIIVLKIFKLKRRQKLANNSSFVVLIEFSNFMLYNNIYWQLKISFFFSPINACRLFTLKYGIILDV